MTLGRERLVENIDQLMIVSILFELRPKPVPALLLLFLLLLFLSLQEKKKNSRWSSREEMKNCFVVVDSFFSFLSSLMLTHLHTLTLSISSPHTHTLSHKNSLSQTLSLTNTLTQTNTLTLILPLSHTNTLVALSLSLKHAFQQLSPHSLGNYLQESLALSVVNKNHAWREHRTLLQVILGRNLL